MIRIAGIGSVLLGDDAVGPYVARSIAAQYELGEGVEVEDLGTPGLDLIAYMTGIDVLILIDSVDNREPAGSVTVYSKEDITRIRPAIRMDPHSPALTESIFIAEMAGGAPKFVYLVGITGESFEVGAGLSEAVRNAVPKAIDVALSLVAKHGGVTEQRAEIADPNCWWEPKEEAAAV